MLRARAGIVGLALCALDAQAQHVERDPWCSEIEAGGWAGEDCRLPGRGDGTLFFDFEGENGSWRLRFQEVDPAGDPVFTSDRLTVEGAHAAPHMRDITGDGVDELFVPYSTGMVNVNAHVFLARQDGWHRIGDIGAVGGAEGLDLRNGLIFSTEPGSAITYVETARRVGEDGLVDVFEVEVNLLERTCRLTRDAGLAATGRTAEDVEAECVEWTWGE